jgi:hypothetical protein
MLEDLLSANGYIVLPKFTKGKYFFILKNLIYAIIL